MQVRESDVSLSYHSKDEVSSLSGDFINAHRSPAHEEIEVLCLFRRPTDTHTHMWMGIWYTGLPSYATWRMWLPWFEEF